jgi:hypothetical protein
VPQFGQYPYTITSVKGGQWTSATGGTLTIPDPTHPGNATILWTAGGTAGKAVYQADAQYIWDMPVNIFQVTAAAPTVGKAAKAGSVVGKVGGQGVLITSQGLVMSSNVTVMGPNANAGLKDLTVGFVQNLMPQTTQATYQIGNKNQIGTIFSPAINSKIDGGNFWDTQVKNSQKFYSVKGTALISGQQLVKSGTNPISTFDAPYLAVPIFGPVGAGKGNIISDTLLWNLNMYITVITDEAPAIYVAEAYMPWVFNGSGTIAPDPKTGVRTWSGNGAAVTFPPDSNNPAWTAATKDTVPPVTNTAQFNSIVQNLTVV